MRGSTTKIAATAANESWNPGSSPDCGIHASRISAPTRERVPAVARPGGDPRERRERARDRSTDDGRLPADRERVREDHEDRDRLAHEPADADDARDHDHADRGDPDVLSRHGEQVHEATRPERVDEVAIDARVLPEHDPGEQAATLPRGSTGKGLLDVRVQPVGDATDPAPPADDASTLPAHHDVDAAAREPPALVEAGLGPSRRDRSRTQLEHGALRRRTLAVGARAEPARGCSSARTGSPRPVRAPRTASCGPGR